MLVVGDSSFSLIYLSAEAQTYATRGSRPAWTCFGSFGSAYRFVNDRVLLCVA